MSTKYLEQQNGKIAYDDSGSGPLVICTPGMGDLRGEYRFLAPQLVAAGYRVVTMDVRGHGESSPSWPDYSVAGIGEDILALNRSLGAGPALLIGTSMAAGAVIWAAAEAPELAAGLILIGPAVHGETNWQGRLLYNVLFARPWGPAMWLWYFSTLYPGHKPDDFNLYKAALGANLKERGRIEGIAKYDPGLESRLRETHAQGESSHDDHHGKQRPGFQKPGSRSEMGVRQPARDLQNDGWSRALSARRVSRGDRSLGAILFTGAERNHG